MESGTPGVKSTRDGWLNRYLQAQQHEAAATPFRAVALAPQLPRIAAGYGAGARDRASSTQFGVRAGQTSDGRRVVRGASTRSRRRRCSARTGREAFDAVKMLKTADPASYVPANGADYPRLAFGEALRQIAQLIKSDVGLEVAFAEVGGWDTHVNQGAAQGQLATRLDDFARAIAAFVADLGDRMADVVVVTMSEFGRAVQRKRQPRHRPRPRQRDDGDRRRRARRQGLRQVARPRASTQRYEGRDLAVTTDFRDVFAEVVTGHLGAQRRATDLSGVRLKQPRRYPGAVRLGQTG